MSGSIFMGYQLRWLRCENALLLSVCFVLGLSACKLDSRIEPTGASPEAQCTVDGVDGVACDSGAAISTTASDAAPTQTDVIPVMTGESGAGANIGGMSGGEAIDASIPPPPPPKKDDGESCATATDCVNGHCLHEICCTGGDCCRTVADCPANIIDGQMVACNEPSTCQGKRGEIRCENFLCIADGDVPDDSACTTEHMAQDCTPYKPVYCNGLSEQEPPACPTSCADDDACIDGAHCQTSTSTCVMDVEEGGDCRIDEDCGTGHCDSNICCAEGDCCRNTLACLRYNTPPMCADEGTCTGMQQVAVCRNHQCASQEMSSPAACNGTTAERCGLYPDVICQEGVRARCATSCRVDQQCKPEAYCRQTPQGGVCERKLRDGEPCTSTSQCQTTCNHGFCCNDSNPDSYCCATSDDCRVLARDECVPDPNSCDGRRVTATCSSDHRCRTESRAAPNACTDREIECGPAYHSRARCPVGCGCTSNQDCAMGYACSAQSPNRGVCEPDTQTDMPEMPGMPGGGMMP